MERRSGHVILRRVYRGDPVQGILFAEAAGKDELLDSEPYLIGPVPFGPFSRLDLAAFTDGSRGCFCFCVRFRNGIIAKVHTLALEFDSRP